MDLVRFRFGAFRLSKRRLCTGLAVVGLAAIAGATPVVCFGKTQKSSPLTAVIRPVFTPNGAPKITHPYNGVSWEIVEVEVTNNSNHAVVLGNSPTRIQQAWTDRDGGGDGDGAPSRATREPFRFVTVQSHRSMKFRLNVPVGLMTTGSKPNLVLKYQSNMGPRHPDAWLGEIHAKIVPNPRR